MSNNCVNNEDKFINLDDLIKEYYCLVQKNYDGLLPYAIFKDYLERPKNVKELIDCLADKAKSENDKLNAIMELWATGGVINVSDSKSFDYKRLIHSISNTTRLQVCIKGNKDGDNVKIINKENLLKFASAVGEYITNHQANNNTTQHKLLENSSFKDLLNNNIDAAINEILFWYYYDDDKYPIINSRAKNSRLILNQVFPKDKTTNDTAFNEKCMQINNFEAIKDNNKIKISKQLMLDQLFYSIDEIKSMKKVDEQYSDKNNEIYKFYKKLWSTIKRTKRVMKKEELSLFKNIIYHGAPGTGKTYELKKEIQEYLDLFESGKSEFIQFHSSYYYEDFIGGLKPTNGTSLILKFKNGIFKQLCLEAAKYEIAYYTHANWDKKELDENTSLNYEMELELPNEEKFLIKENEPVLSQFPPYFILIDEINRADLSKVFGELLFAIEDDYRGFVHKFKLSTSQMETEDTAVYTDKGEHYFFVPKNLYIRGTMNDIDRSVDSIDFAFRRRFKWVEKKYDKDILSTMLLERYLNSNDKSVLEYIKKCTTLNDKIIKDISIADESYKIGHAIFRNIIKYAKESKDIQEYAEKLFDNHIEPILYNYLKMDYGNEKKDLQTFKDVFLK
jgi:5-methylcytosine-specific restriction protein B